MFLSNLTRVLFRHALKTAIAILLLSAVTLAWGRTSLPAIGATGAPSAQAPAGRVFGSDAGMILNAIKADKTEDFEAVLAKVKEALQKSEAPGRKQQGASWRVFKAVERGANNSALYVFWFDPPVKDADYTVSKILAEAFPTEARDLYQKFSDAYVGGQNVINLQLLSRMGD
jgi:hypothetical protein